MDCLIVDDATFVFCAHFITQEHPSSQRPLEVPKESREEEVEACQVEITVIGLDEPVPLEEYVKGVVSAEMPVTFHEEALKAQAIAARTYALRDNGIRKKTNCSRRFCSSVFYQEERKERWGKEFQTNEKK